MEEEEGCEILEIRDEEVEVWRDEQGVVRDDEEIHLFIADSNGSGLVAAGIDVQPPDILINRSFGCVHGVAVIWLSGNDSYPHPRRPSEPVVDVSAMEAYVVQVIRDLSAVAKRVLIIGPVPRFRFDRGLPWERTPAYQAERLLLRVSCREELAPIVQLHCVGRYFTVRVRSRRVVGDKCGRLFASDGIHLSPEGYRLVLDKLPQWLRPGGEAAVPVSDA
ncbi:hypothetical protein FJT64_008963 [Amphibalanus amphitrite]|uniref:SGNH hydrolase-type esterase domain-containing protein n=1 Tax=Amphibalanus amphitrite TaxID=1232801 RepID=A0A6A4VGQ4_AMPAM|nr:hypothetical protein FJT64_008963 [Amphibalanus amphitrite]